MNNRYPSIVKQYFFLVLLFMLTLPVFAQEIGVQLYTFRKQLPGDVPAVLKKISTMGIRELEGGDTYGLSQDEFKSLLIANNLQVVSVGADFNQLSKDPLAFVSLARAYGAKYVVVFWIPHKEVFSIDDARNAINVFNTAGKMLKENGISLCYHPHGYEFGSYGKETLLDYMIRSTNPDYVNYEMDVFWVKHPGQDPVKLLKKYPGRFPLMHLKDRKIGTLGNQSGHADVESNVVLGSGDVGIRSIMKAARKAGVKHYFIEDESSRSLEQVPLSLAYLQSLK